MTGNPGGSAVDFRDVSFSYDGQTLALDGLTFAVEQGSFVCVLGGNGSGKSTLARHVDALLLPDGGKVHVLGLDTADPQNLFAIRSNAGIVFQNPDDQMVAATVEEDVAFGPENIRVPSTELPGRVAGALVKVGLQGFAQRETNALSGGQKQRVAIAGVYAMDPRVLVLDEAGAMLDPGGRAGLARLCRQLNEAGITIVQITHFMEEAAAADRVVVLDGGCIAMDGAPAQVLSDARRLQDLALEAPFAVRMSMALQDAGVPVKTCIAEEELERTLAELPGLQAVPGSTTTEECVFEGENDVSGIRRQGEDVPVAPLKPVISFNGVSFSYAPKQARRAARTPDARSEEGGAGASWGGDGGDPWALRNASFDLFANDLVGIAGHTGSGKSTLAHLAAGLIRPTEGVVLVDGQDTAARRSQAEIRRSVGMVFQYPEHQLFAQTVHEDVAFGPRNLGLPEDEVARRVAEALDLVHLDSTIAAKSPFELSGGQQRRVALAGVLAMQPDVLILDEPTAGLDPHARQLFFKLIAELHWGGGGTTVIVSHNMDDLAVLCTRMLLLDKGHVVADGDPRTIFSDERAIRSIGLDVPRTVHLANRLGMMESFDTLPTIESLASAIACRCACAKAGKPL